MNTCSKCKHPIDDGVKFCTECGSAVSGCPKCGQPIVDGIKFCTECGASVVAPKKPNERMGLSLPSTPIEKPALSVNNNAGTSPAIDLHFSAFEAEVKKPINKNRILVIVMLLSGVLGFVFLGVAVFRAIKGSDTVNQSSTATITPVSSSPTAPGPTATQASAQEPTQATSQPQPSSALPENEDCSPSQPNPSTTPSNSLVDALDGKKLRVGNLSCDLNGGTYSVFSRKCGYLIVLAGQKQAAGTKHTFEYPLEEPTSFTYNDRYYATGNDTVATYLGEDAISGMDEIKVDKLDDGQIRITSKQWTLNLQDMVKRVESYEIKSDEQTTRLCEP